MKNLNTAERAHIKKETLVYLPSLKKYFRILYKYPRGMIEVYDNQLMSYVISTGKEVLLPETEEEFLLAETMFKLS